VRAQGIHAGGVLIAPSALTDYCSLVASPGKVVCSLDMEDVDVMGLLKVDLLGLKTVSVIHQAAAMVGVDIDNVPLDDPEVYRLYQEGRTHGVFQVSGTGLTHYLKQVKPGQFSDLVDVLALYRPGPLTALTESGRTMVEQYVYNREHPDEMTYLHPDLEEILEPSYGVLVYQEQLMMMARKLAGFTMGEADELRKAVAKKLPEKLAKLRDKFVSGGVANGYPEELMDQLFDQIEKFAQYAFNKSHSCAYAYLSYQTAYLKAHYPVEFMCALLSSETDNPEKTMQNVAECRRMGIPILPVDANESDIGFKIEALPDGRRAIRFGLTGIKSIGQAVAEEIVAKRPYTSLRDFVQRVERRRINKKVMETLILAGLFDSFEPNRYKVLREYLYEVRKYKPEKVSCPEPEAWNDIARYWLDIEWYGFALSGHPAEGLPNAHWLYQPFDTPFYVSGIVFPEKVNRFKEKHGRDMATVFLDTPFGQCKVHLYPRTWQKYRSLIVSGRGAGGDSETPLLLTFLVKRRKYMRSEVLEVIKVHVPDEARTIWEAYLEACLTPYFSRRSRSLIRFYT
jgi:DNA polymerase-3 subunit alpha